jgi:hypothetical protein
MRTAEAQLRAALGNPEFTLEPGALRVQGKWFVHYEINLPKAFQRGIPKNWRFSLLSKETGSLIPSVKSEILLEALRTIETHSTANAAMPLVILCDEPELRMNDELDHHRYPKAFFLDHSDFAEQPRNPEPPRSAPFLLSIRRKLNDQESARILSPYVPNQPAYDWRFFGRQKEIRRIVYSTENLIVVGARRIGKTSLLKYLERTFVRQKLSAYYLNVQDCMNENDIVQRIMSVLDPRDRESLERQRTLLPDRMLYMILKRLSGKENAIIIIDELGNIIGKSKDDWKVIGVLRTFAQSGKLRIIASGFQEFLLIQQSNFEGPWVNFFSTVRLAGISRDELREFVVAPLSNWINIQNPDALLDLVVRAVGLHPLTLQYFCQGVFVKSIRDPSADIMEISKSIIGKDILLHFSEAVDSIFFRLPALIQYIYLSICHEAVTLNKRLYDIIIDDQDIIDALGKLGRKEPSMARRNILQSLEIGGLTQAENENVSRQRVITPIIYLAVKRTEEGNIERFISILRTEVSA